MGEYSFLTELGFGLSALALIWIVVKYFIGAITAKDEYIKDIIKSFQTNVDSFNTTINKHIDHQTAQAKKETAALNNLTRAINLLVKKIDK